jgi:hypothetical protein
MRIRCCDLCKKTFTVFQRYAFIFPVMRPHEHKPMAVRGWITGLGQQLAPCVVEDISSEGAKLLIRSGQPPDMFSCISRPTVSPSGIASCCGAGANASVCSFQAPRPRLSSLDIFIAKAGRPLRIFPRTGGQRCAARVSRTCGDRIGPCQALQAQRQRAADHRENGDCEQDGRIAGPAPVGSCGRSLAHVRCSRHKEVGPTRFRS